MIITRVKKTIPFVLQPCRTCTTCCIVSTTSCTITHWKWSARHNHRLDDTGVHRGKGWLGLVYHSFCRTHSTLHWMTGVLWVVLLHQWVRASRLSYHQQLKANVRLAFRISILTFHLPTTNLFLIIQSSSSWTLLSLKGVGNRRGVNSTWKDNMIE